MTGEETSSYLRHHDTLAGRSDALFSDDAAASIHQPAAAPESSEQPRRLVAGFAADKAIVDESSNRTAVAEVTAK